MPMRKRRAQSWVTATAVAAVAFGLGAQSIAQAGPWDGVRAWETVRVTRIVDGDTFIASDTVTGVESRVRLIGINAPEIQTKAKAGQCGWWQAKDALATAAPVGSIVRLAAVDQASTGLNGRPQRVALAYNDATGAYDIDLAWAIAEQGWALWFTEAHEAAMSSLYQAVVAGAQQRGVGIWNPRLCGSVDAPDAVISVRIGRAPAGTGFNNEWVTVRNGGAAPVDISGWMLREGGLQGWLTFPPGTYLTPGDYRVVHTGFGTAGLPDGHDLYAWASKRLYPDPGTAPSLIGDGAYLLDRAGNYRFWREYPCTSLCDVEPLSQTVVIDAVSIGTKRGNARTRSQWVRLANRSGAVACLDGYRLDTGAASYQFTPGTCIAPGSTWTLHAGIGKGDASSAYWGRKEPALWSSGTATLTSDREQLVASGTW